MNKLSTLSAACFAAFAAVPVFANPADTDAAATSEAVAEQHIELEEIKVVGTAPRRTATEHINREAISREMINDSRDLVRYSADVGISDDGRRTKGFAIRGVEENRVGISIDGVSLPEAEENSLYQRYGNFNNSRLSIDPEFVRSIEVSKGADSLHSGSGALGGNVTYRTLNGADLLREDREIGGQIKSGYNSKNREWVNTLGLGFNNGTVDAALMYVRRHGHELKSNGGDVATLNKPFNSATEYETKRFSEVGSARIYPDPSTHNNHGWLAKIGWQINPEHKVGLSLNGQKNNNQVNELSYSLTTSWREADDVQKRLNSNLFYEYTPDNNAYLSSVRADADYQKTENGAINHKGNYEGTYIRTGNWRNDYTHYEKGWQTNRDFRNNKTQFARFSLSANSQSLEWGKTTHDLSLKLAAGQRKFENINTDHNLNPAGDVIRTEVYTIQYPVRTNQYRLSLLDRFRLNEHVSGHLGAAYDYTKVKPSEPNGIPCGKSSSFGRLCSGSPESTSFKDWSFAGGINWHLNKNWTAGYQFATGFRVPTASEMYFTFESVYGNWLANPDLKSERSLNHTLFLQGHGDKGKLSVNLYQSRYKDFLYEQETSLTRKDPSCDAYAAYYTNCTGERTDYFQQMVNLDKARVRGLEINGSLDLHQVSALPEGWKLFSSLGYSKGSMNTKDGRLSMLSVQPMKFVFGLDYEQPDHKYGVFSRLTYAGAKKAKHAQAGEYATRCTATERRWDWATYDYANVCTKEEAYTKVSDYRFLNKRSWVFDMFGYYRPTKNLTLRGGVYNIFDTKYHTWDSLRGINMNSTINSISRVHYERGNLQGLERYYAPGRNFAASIQYKF